MRLLLAEQRVENGMRQRVAWRLVFDHDHHAALAQGDAAVQHQLAEQRGAQSKADGAWRLAGFAAHVVVGCQVQLVGQQAGGVSSSVTAQPGVAAGTEQSRRQARQGLMP
jgi:hypothetical protein